MLNLGRQGHQLILEECFGVVKTGNGCGFFRWVDANNSTCQEQYNLKNPSTNSEQGRHKSRGRQERHGRQKRSSISLTPVNVALVGLSLDVEEIVGLTPIDVALVGLSPNVEAIARLTPVDVALVGLSTDVEAIIGHKFQQLKFQHFATNIS
ncbi:hypothetical protein H5410_052188 [Solanum commersonii]|uniref:Uncharacterized protein n=1 Tax=Solanum commersonii TaxID=4109 RepID=A0A9J5X054_SOLCO|nr:hypothetical protein H5410_052188 [Solanum commersonii]